MLSPVAKKGLRDLPASPDGSSDNVTRSGPEGGFAAEEEAAAQVAGFIPLRLGAHTAYRNRCIGGSGGNAGAMG